MSCLPFPLGCSQLVSSRSVIVVAPGPIVALHDCDIVNYNRQLLAVLYYTAVHAYLSFEFCEGYYARVTDRLHRRDASVLTPI